MRKVLWLLLAAACGSGSSGGSTGPATADGVTLMSGFDPGSAPASGTGFQVVTPIVSNVAAGGNYEYCTWTNVVLQQDVWIKSSKALQTATGHHVVVYYTTSPAPAGQSRLCNDSDMASFHFAVAALGEAANGANNVLPGDLAVKVPKGAQIVINHHYLNASASAVAQAQSAVSVFYATPGSKIVESSSIAFVNTGMEVPPGASSVDFTCTTNQAFQTWMMFPHMHQYGTRVTIDHTNGGTTDRLFDVQWDPSYTFHPVTHTEDPSKPYVLQKGDQLHVHCDYNNTTSQTLSFGAEMCVLYGATVDAAGVGNLACDQGTWTSF